MRLTIRTRLTLLYSALFVTGGLALLLVSYAFISSLLPSKPVVTTLNAAGRQPASGTAIVGNGTPGGIGTVFESPVALSPDEQAAIDTQFATQLGDQIDRLRHQVLSDFAQRAGLAFGAFTIGSVALAWFVAGRALRPLHRVTETARRMSTDRLHERLDLAGPADEIHDLAVTFNGLLDRVEAGFGRERRFVAMASHELRTPLTVERTLLEVALSDEDRTADAWRRTGQNLLANTARTERLVEMLFTLTRASTAPLAETQPVDVAAVVHQAVRRRAAELDARQLRLSLMLNETTIQGSRLLVEQLVDNLLANAIVHNVDRGWITIRTERAVLSVANSGREPIGDTARLLEPFQRGRSPSGHRGAGLGLTIVKAIADRHHATLHVEANDAHGLNVAVCWAEVAGGRNGESARAEPTVSRHDYWAITSEPFDTPRGLSLEP